MHPAIAHDHASHAPSLRATRFAGGKPGSDAISPDPENAAAVRPPRLLDRLREALRVHGHSLGTEQAYVSWAERFVHFHHRRHPVDLDEVDVARFLRHLARDPGSPPAARSQAFAALLFLYREVLHCELDWHRAATCSGRRKQANPPAHCGSSSLIGGAPRRSVQC
jgi:hypothetical protein